ncbi:hypothetical protein CAPTEDRAFT_187122 [Capitella teleta]|uniref:G-protein coupled receptors family 1 profile domain-containing protein n=1 Tax=Capitella teleta TaxID=283909 RepID=R7VAU1_CAPTE|nr:hypothetical protein CAPTEDRAFT_187122 [Capitella teleta]|eukprot:ELU15647.1 hypothetical protein CAPTEDRAFT_187122 [Capitella teleta]
MKTVLVFYLLLSAHFRPSIAYRTTTDQDSTVELQTFPDNIRPTFDPYQLWMQSLAKVKAIEFVVTLVIGTLGVIGNLLILVVTVHYNYIGIPQVYMATLAISDLCIAVFGLWRVLADNLYFLSDGVYWFCVHTYFPVIGLDAAASITASLTAMALSLDRYLALKYPMKHSEYWPVDKAKILTVTVGLISLIFGITYPLRYYISTTRTPGKNMLPPEWTSLGENQAFTKTSVCVEFFFRFALPVVVMAVTNTATMAIIHKSDKFRRSMSKYTQSTINTPKCLTMTVGIVIIFFITNLPKACFMMDFIIFQYSHSAQFNTSFITFAYGGNLLAKLNSIVNIIVYFTLDSEFRATLLKSLRISGRRPVEAACNIAIAASLQNATGRDHPNPPQHASEAQLNVFVPVEEENTCFQDTRLSADDTFWGVSTVSCQETQVI